MLYRVYAYQPDGKTGHVALDRIYARNITDAISQANIVLEKDGIEVYNVIASVNKHDNDSYYMSVVVTTMIKNKGIDQCKP